MKKILTLLMCSGIALFAHGAFDVREFGAAGDGVHDDTAAIQTALLAAASAPVSSEVYFASGTYRVTRPLLVPNGPARTPQATPQKLETVHLRGDNAVIAQENPAHDIFYFDWTFRVLVEGLTLRGGNRQLKFWTGNTDTSRITVRDCRFEGASGAAIDDTLRQDTAKDNWLAVLPPYDFRIHEDGHVEMTPAPEADYPYFYFTSTLMHIADCEFDDCARALAMTTDWAVMENCRIRTGTRQQMEAITSGGHLFLDHCRAEAPEEPLPGRIFLRKTADMNQDGVNLRNVDFSGSWEYILRNECEFSANQASFLVAGRCRFPAAANPAGALFDWVKLPNQILLTGNRYATDAPVNRFPGAPYPDDYLHCYTPDTYAYCGDAQMNLLPVMAPWRDRELTEEEIEFLEAGEITPGPRKALRQRIAASGNVRDFGAVGDGAADDAPAFQAALDAAGAHAAMGVFAEVVVPSGNYLLGRSVRLPEAVAIRGEGTAYIRRPPEATDPAFTGHDVRLLLLQKLYFIGGAQDVHIRNAPELEAELVFDQLDVKFTTGYSLQVQCGDGGYEDRGRTRLTVSDSTFAVAKALKHNVRAALNCVWISSDPDAQREGAIANHGDLYFNALVGVPLLDRIYRTGTTFDTRGNDHRWIDNYGNVALDRCRFGGEYGGMPAIVNHRAGARISIRESWLYHSSGNRERLTHVDCEALPDRVLLWGNLGWFAPAGLVRLHGETADAGCIREAGNLPAAKIEIQ